MLWFIVSAVFILLGILCISAALYINDMAHRRKYKPCDCHAVWGAHDPDCDSYNEID